LLRLNDILDRVAAYHPDPDLDLIKKAYVYSAKVHQGQLRKSGEPYLVHPLEVAGLLADLKLDEASVVTGLLHDTIEDTLATKEEIGELFGAEIADLVDGVTKLSQFAPGNTQEEKQAENFRKMVVAMAKDIRVLLVKLADRIHNMRTLDHMKAESQERIARETLDIYAPLANRLGMQAVKTELEELSFKYLKPADFADVDTAADDICLMAFTSGTTGVPKGTMHFHRDVMAICACWPPHVLRAGADDIFIGSPPLAFTYGLGGLLLFPISVGAATVLLDKITPQSLFEALPEYKATVLFTAPTSYRALAVEAGARRITAPLGGTLRKCASAGEVLPAATRALWKQHTGIELIDGIGATEMLHVFISADEAHARPGATGTVVPGYRACVLGDDGRPVPPGTIGRLAVKGPTGCRYLADERQGRYVVDGWNLTGDAYRMDAEGYFHYCSRTDDMIISAGYNIGAPEVEDALLAHPAVAECAVVGVPDEERGQIVKAFVVLRPGQAGDAAMTRALQDFVKQAIAPYKYPRAVAYLDALPRTETGKLQRFKLKPGAAG